MKTKLITTLMLSALIPFTSVYANPPKAEKLMAQVAPKPQLFQDTNTGKYGYKLTDNIVIPAIYDEAPTDLYDYATVRQGEYWGVIDKQGNAVVPMIYDKIHKTYSKQNAIIVQKDNHWGVIDYNGETITPMIYDDIRETGKYFYVKKDNAVGVLDTNGQTILRLIYDDIKLLLSNPVPKDFNFLVVTKQNKKGIYHNTGKEILPVEFDKLSNLNNGILPLLKNGKWGIIAFKVNKDNEIDIKEPYKILAPFNLEYDDIEGFYNHISVVKKNNKYGYIDKTGQLVIGLIYDHATPFYSDFLNKSNRHPLAFVTINQDNQAKVGAINPAGKVIIPIIYDNIQSKIYDSFIKVIKDNKLGLYSRHGTLLLEPEYDTIFIEHCIFLIQKSCDVIIEKDGTKQTLTIWQDR